MEKETFTPWKTSNGWNDENTEEAKENAKTILTYLTGQENFNPSAFPTQLTECLRQYYTWGANKFMLLLSDEGNTGLQFNVTGMKFRGRVRVWYDAGVDYFRVEFLKARKLDCVQMYDDLDFTQLHNVLHQFIERTDDKECFDAFS